MFKKYQMSFKVSAYIILLFIAFILSGCGTTMPLTKKTTQLDITKDSIGIVSLKLSNKFKPSCQPHVIYFKVAGIDTGSEEKFHVDAWGHNEAFNEVKDEFNEYLLNFKLSPGRYKIGEMKGYCEVWAVLPAHGMFTFPIDVEFELNPTSITYIGHLEMVNRERKEDEPRSGSIIPLFDQAVTGFSGGTFDITISDTYLDDVKKIKDNYPSIGGYEIKRNIAILSKPKSVN